MAITDLTVVDRPAHPAHDQILEKLRLTFGGIEDGTPDTVAYAVHGKLEETGELSVFERECCDWGACFGVAYALLRDLSSSWATREQIANEARDIAWTFWCEWSNASGFDGRPSGNGV